MANHSGIAERAAKIMSPTPSFEISQLSGGGLPVAWGRSELKVRVVIEIRREEADVEITEEDPGVRMRILISVDGPRI